METRKIRQGRNHFKKKKRTHVCVKKLRRKNQRKQVHKKKRKKKKNGGDLKIRRERIGGVDQENAWNPGERVQTN